MERVTDAIFSEASIKTTASASLHLRRGRIQNCNVTSYLTVPLSCATIQTVQEQLRRRDPFNFWYKGSKRTEPKHKILKILEMFGWNTSDLTWQEYNPALTVVEGPPLKVEENEVDEAFNRLTLGRQLSMGDLRRLARELKIKEDEIKKLAQKNVEQGRAKWIAAVRSTGKGWQCQRCGARDVEEWPSQGSSSYLSTESIYGIINVE